jgi:hypothetical protein
MSDEKSYAVGRAPPPRVWELNTGPWTIHDDDGNPELKGEPDKLSEPPADGSRAPWTYAPPIAWDVPFDRKYLAECLAGYVLPLGWKRGWTRWVSEPIDSPRASVMSEGDLDDLNIVARAMGITA